MRVLLDECLPRRLVAEFEGLEVITVPEAGWSGKSNGELLDLAAGDFDVLVTIDRGMQFQQNIAGRQLAILAFAAVSNRVDDLRPIDRAGAVRQHRRRRCNALRAAQPGAPADGPPPRDRERATIPTYSARLRARCPRPAAELRSVGQL